MIHHPHALLFVHVAPVAWTLFRTAEPAEIDLLDLEAWEVPRRLSDEDRRTHTGAEGRRKARTEPEQEDDQ